MRIGSKLWFSVIVAFAVPTATRAIAKSTGTNQYQAIPERNVFGLKPAEQAPTPTPQPKNSRKVILTGITTLMGSKRALLKVEPVPGHNGEKEESMMLTEGQREGDIEVIQIDEKAKKVTLNNGGTEMTITFERQAPTLPGGNPAAVPALTAPATAAVPPPLSAPAPTGRPYSRQTRWPMNSAVAPAPTTGAGPNAVPNTAAPAPAIATPAPAAQPGSPAATQLTPEEQAIIAEIQQQVNQNNPNPVPPPNTIVPTNPGVTAPAIAPPGLKVPQTTTPAASGVAPGTIMPQ